MALLAGAPAGCHRAATGTGARTPFACGGSGADSVAAHLSELGARARAAGARSDLQALRALSDSVDSLRRETTARCRGDSAAAD